MSKVLIVSCLAALMTLTAGAPRASAGLTIAGQFNPGLGQLVGSAWDQVNGTMWVYRASDTLLLQYSLGGSLLSSVPRPGESANDFDLEVAPVALMLNATPVPAGTLLVINGENGVAEIYAVDKATGAVLATLVTAFGTDHVVGGAYHPQRGTFFLVQDKVATGAANQSLVAEVNASTGAVIGTFKVDTVLPGFTVNFGDIDVSTATGNLFVVSSDESSIAEFTPAGVLVQQLPLPGTVVGLSGIGLNDAGGGAVVTGTNGTITRLASFTWSELGGALPGTSGAPALIGAGTLVSGSPTALTVKAARPLSSAFLITGFSQLGAFFKGGTLVPNPDIVLAGFPIDAGGNTGLPFAWPAGVPSGFATYFQFWIIDPVGPAGFAATNGLRALAP